MSRPSLYPGRESIFPGRAVDATLCPQYAAACVEAAEECNNIMLGIRSTLKSGVSDVPRLSKVLNSSRLFMLVDEVQVKQFKQQTTDEVKPQLDELLRRASMAISILEKKYATMQSQNAALRAAATARPIGMHNKAGERRVQLLRAQKERMEKEIVEMQADIDTLENEIREN